MKLVRAAALVTCAALSATAAVNARAQVQRAAPVPAPRNSTTLTPQATNGARVISLAEQPLERLRIAQDEALRVRGESTFFFRGEFTIDADGSPRAYHPGYTCENANSTGWKLADDVDCSARPLATCRTKGFRGAVAGGAIGDYVRCSLGRGSKRGTCVEVSRSRRRQGACRMDAQATTGLDWLPNAGAPGNFYGISTSGPNTSGAPIVQGPTDPAPGFYVSTTALVNPRAADGTPARYVDSSRFNYVALPPSAVRSLGAGKGDYVAAINWRTGTIAGAIFADVSSERDEDVGEGSIALAQELGIRGTPKGGGGDEDVVYVVLAGTSAGFPTDPELVKREALAKFAAWGGIARVKLLMPDWAAQFASAATRQ